VLAKTCAHTQDYCVPASRPLHLDDLDHKLLEHLQQDAGRTLDELGEAIGLSPSAVQRRIRRYRSNGLIVRQVAVLDPEAVSGVVLAAVFVTLESESIREHNAFRQRMRTVPEVQQCYSLAGERDYLVIVVAGGMRECRDVVDRLFMDDPNVKRYTTHLVFDVVKTSLAVSTRSSPGIAGRLKRRAR
jgi:Lrp/AsnC family transcriptional regulator, leucine-responsive regulatory protein